MSYSIPGGMSSAGKKIHIRGSPCPDPGRFTVNLQSGPSDEADIVFHFDVRINWNNKNRKVLVRTHRSGGSWGPEERATPCFPFAENCKFDMEIQATKSCFEVYVNRQHLVDFVHRRPVEEARFISISGDVTVDYVKFE